MGEIQNLVLLALCWACTLSSSTLLTSVGPLTAEQLGAPESLAPLAVACFLFGAAITSVPSAWIFRRCGRCGGFLIGSALIVASGGAGVAGLWLGELWLIYGATLLAGLGQGFGQFYRFAAMEVCTPARKPFAVTLVLSGGVLAAFAGPQLSVWAAPLVGPHYTGCFLVVSAIGLLNGVVAASVRYAPEASVGHGAASPMLSAEVGGMALPPPVPLARLMAQPRCVVAVAMATAAHTSMVMLMSPLTVAMRNAGLSAQLGDLALEVHFFCMFAPGFVSGRLIGAAGPARTALLGVALFADYELPQLTS